MQIGLMLDCSRNAVMTISMIKKFIDIMKKMGYTSLQLYTEDTYEVEKEPMFGYLRGKYTKDELKEIDAYAKSRSVELIPCVQVLAHLKGIFRHWEYKEINDIDDILLVGDERTYRLIEHIFQTLAECFSSRRVNIGMDEAYLLGRGKFSDEHGFPKKFDILLSHLKKVSEIANKYGFRPMMWSDMFFRPVNYGDYYGKNYGMNGVPENIRKKVPENIELVYWEYFQTESKYYDRMIERHKEFDKPFYYAGGVSCWTGFVPNNRYAIETLRAAVHSCQKYGVKEVFVTLWGDNGAETSFFAALPSLFFLAEISRGTEDMDLIKEKFLELTGLTFDDFLLMEELSHIHMKENLPANAEKCFLYQDCFTGLFDGFLSGKEGKLYSRIARSLKEVAGRGGEYAYIFESCYRLAEVLSVKATIGVRTHNVYKAGNKSEAAELVKEYTLLIKRLEKFYSAFHDLWYRENKGFGFEVHDIRIGGLIQRVKNCRQRLSEWAENKSEKIDELEEDNTKYFPGAAVGGRILFNDYASTVTLNNL